MINNDVAIRELRKRIVQLEKENAWLWNEHYAITDENIDLMQERDLLLKRLQESESERFKH